jgi:hypothetical protein
MFWKSRSDTGRDFLPHPLQWPVLSTAMAGDMVGITPLMKQTCPARPHTVLQPYLVAVREEAGRPATPAPHLRREV